MTFNCPECQTPMEVLDDGVTKRRCRNPDCMRLIEVTMGFLARAHADLQDEEEEECLI